MSADSADRPPPASPFDAEIPAALLSRACRRERAAQEALYRRFERPVYSLLRRMTGCPDQAWDLTQDSFLHAFERLPQFRGEAPFGRWLRTIAATQGLMHLRSQRRFVELFAPEDQAGDEPAVEDLAQADLERALSLLAPLPRAVLWLYHVEGYTHVEIAGFAGRTVSFSKSQLSRAHQKLRELFGHGPSEAAAAGPPAPLSGSHPNPSPNPNPQSVRAPLLEVRP